MSQLPSPSPSPSRFIEEVYKYCDLWCECCRFSDRCIVRHQELERVQGHLEAGVGPGSPEAVLRDFDRINNETSALLDELASDPATAEILARVAVRPLVDPVTTDLCQWGHAWADRVSSLLALVPGGDAPWTFGAEEFPPPDDLQIREDIERLNEYTGLIPVKLGRAAASWGDAEYASEGAADHLRADALGTAKLVDECFTLALAAARRLAGEAASASLREKTEELRSILHERFPGFPNFVRPGFDE